MVSCLFQRQMHFKGVFSVKKKMKYIILFQFGRQMQ